jgi:hypothetical protein
MKVTPRTPLKQFRLLDWPWPPSWGENLFAEIPTSQGNAVDPPAALLLIPTPNFEGIPGRQPNGQPPAALGPAQPILNMGPGCALNCQHPDDPPADGEHVGEPEQVPLTADGGNVALANVG